MCNLYRMTRTVDEVAKLFAVDHVASANVAAEVYPGYPGWVMAKGQLCGMTWGFPLVLKGAKAQPLKPKPVNNARADKLSSPFWRHAFEQGRCLVPVSAFAEAAGEKGRKTRTWFAVPDQPVFAVAGLWRNSAEFGRCFSMVMTEACVDIGGLHDRMPVILQPADAQRWIETDDRDEALSLCAPWAHGLDVTATAEPWNAIRS